MDIVVVTCAMRDALGLFSWNKNKKRKDISTMVGTKGKRIFKYFSFSHHKWDEKRRNIWKSNSVSLFYLRLLHLFLFCIRICFSLKLRPLCFVILTSSRTLTSSEPCLHHQTRKKKTNRITKNQKVFFFTLSTGVSFDLQMCKSRSMCFFFIICSREFRLFSLYVEKCFRLG